MKVITEMLRQIERNGGPLTDAQRERLSLIKIYQDEIYDLDTDIEIAREEIAKAERRRARLAEKLTAMGVRVDP